MGYRFCLGASGSGKSRMLHSMILERAEKAIRESTALQENNVIIVPDQYSMQTQKEIVMESPDQGILNIDVLSFGRLTHRIFEEIGVPERAVLDDTGKTLLIRRTAGKCGKELKILGKSIHYPGMIAEIKSVLSEFMQYGIGEKQLSMMQEYASGKGRGALSARLEDLRVLYSAFMQGKKDRFITSEERLDLLAEAIPYSDLVKRSVFVLDGFTGFTPVQYRVIAALIRYAKEVVISLPYGNDDGPTLPWVHEHRMPGNEDALFYLTRKTVSDLDKIASREGLTRKSDMLIGREGDAPVRFKNNPCLSHLERHIFRYPLTPMFTGQEGRIRIFETDTAEEEVRQICIQIKKLILTKGYQYRDISVVCGDLVQYGRLFEKQAARYDIPVYIDKTDSAGLNPLTEAIRSALQIRPQGYSYTAVFRYLRSGMSDITREEADLLENYCLEHGIRGRKKWSLPFDARTEPLRQRFLKEIEPVAGRIDQERTAAASASERTKALYRFMTALSMEEKTARMSQAFREAGDFVRERQYSQLYRYVIDLLEQIHDLLGEEVISSKEYGELLEAGFAEIRLGTLPQQADRVLVGDIERTRLSQCSILFFAGVNDGNIPRGTSRGGLLSDLDRDFLRHSGAELSPTPRQQMYLQKLYLYLNLTKPTDALFLSFARTAPDGGTLHPSYLIQMIGKLFPDTKIEHPQLAPACEQLTGEKDSVVWLSGALRDYAQGKIPEGSKEDAELKTAYGYLIRKGERETAQALEMLKDAAFTMYSPVWISKETARALYGHSVMGGISRLETAAQCSLRQFLQYGLRLAERKEYMVGPVDTGTILHQSLERFSKKLIGNGLSWSDFTPEEGNRIAADSLRETAGAYKELVMYSTKRSEYQLAGLERILQRSVDTLRYQLSRGQFVPEGYEFSFGPEGDADMITAPLSGGRSLKLVGRIDRIDLCREEDGIFVKILDYKSGSLDLDEELIRRGIQLQLILYMNAVLDQISKKNPGKPVVPSAMLYYRITDPVIDSGEPASDAENDPSDPEKAAAKIRAALRPTGMVNADPVSFSHLHTGIGPREKSDVIPLSLSADGSPGRGSHVYTAEQFDRLTNDVREIVCKLAEEILDGKAAAEPAVWGSSRSACDYCPYKSVCGFDPSIDGFRYRDR